MQNTLWRGAGLRCFSWMGEQPFWDDAPALTEWCSCACIREDTTAQGPLSALDFGAGVATPAMPATPPLADAAMAWGERGPTIDQMQIEATILSGHAAAQSSAECEMVLRDQPVLSTPSHHLPEEFAGEYWMQATSKASDVPDRLQKPSPPTSQQDRKRILMGHPSAFLDPNPKNAQEEYLARRRTFLSHRERRGTGEEEL